MGLIERLFGLVFGGGRNVLVETAEVFRENAEAAALRGQAGHSEALDQFAKEFAGDQRGTFDRLMDGLNRLPRPLLAFGTLGMFIAAMVDPLWFAARMQGIALVPEPLWWLLGAIVSFYFGARHQAKGQAFQRDVARSLVGVQQARRTMRAISALEQGQEIAATGPDADLTLEATAPEANPALADWQRLSGRDLR